MRRFLVAVVALAASVGLLGSLATPAGASKKLGDIIVCVTEPCP